MNTSRRAGEKRPCPGASHILRAATSMMTTAAAMNPANAPATECPTMCPTAAPASSSTVLVMEKPTSKLACT